MTRENLKDILRANIDLYREEEDFYEYITTLVIYLMENEYESSAIREAKKSVELFRTIPTRRTAAPDTCPHCNHVIDIEKKICPYCLILIEK